ncbi:MAG: TIM barrel protein [Burkholderiales bacterium]|jgi:hydroxypyruvate isomerase
MPGFAANLHYLFTEVPFIQRFDAAARAGFRAVEFQVPYDYPAADLRERLRANDLAMVLFDAPTGNWQQGDRGLTAVPGREQEFRASLPRVVKYAEALDCHTVHVMAGVVAREEYDEAHRVYVDNLRYATRFLGDHGITTVIEPINNRLGDVSGGPDYTTRGMHGYFLNHTRQARRIIEEVDVPGLFLHLDCYHMQMLEGNLSETIRENMAMTRHFQIAGVPGRHEPDVGEINYPFLFDLMDQLGYKGWVGLEYRPKTTTIEGLKWAAAYGIG